MRRKGERKKGRKEDLIDSSFEFRHSDDRSLLGPELKLDTLQVGGVFFPTLVNFYLSVLWDRLAV